MSIAATQLRVGAAAGRCHMSDQLSLVVAAASSSSSLLPCFAACKHSPAGSHQQLCAHTHRLGAVKGDAPKAAPAGSLQPGLLVAFKKDDRTELGLLLQPDGKKNWWITNQV
jgi:hypothetical protein